jgi:hypothetical protein
MPPQITHDTQGSLPTLWIAMLSTLKTTIIGFLLCAKLFLHAELVRKMHQF